MILSFCRNCTDRSSQARPNFYVVHGLIRAAIWSAVVRRAKCSQQRNRIRAILLKQTFCVQRWSGCVESDGRSLWKPERSLGGPGFDLWQLALLSFATPNKTPINDDSANDPIARQFQSDYHDTLPWLISFSLIWLWICQWGKRSRWRGFDRCNSEWVAAGLRRLGSVGVS